MDAQPVDDLLDGGWFTTEELARRLGGRPLDLAPLADRPAPAGTTVHLPVLASDLVQRPRCAALARHPPD
jgi:hypothetical protein